ncbi:hypothetical protein GCM10009017_24650 [Halarchaeum rubridurum]|uniref:Uncharacterized protein n=1 Tax=Halarchaeum rubridurum TaxID=489911 RepID=A0A830G378_9EURY|nr:hypothetical protein GCM10009017_24650 [Halarchaeum rubridurum]
MKTHIRNRQQVEQRGGYIKLAPMQDDQVAQSVSVLEESPIGTPRKSVWLGIARSGESRI